MNFPLKIVSATLVLSLALPIPAKAYPVQPNDMDIPSKSSTPSATEPAETSATEAVTTATEAPATVETEAPTEATVPEETVPEETEAPEPEYPESDVPQYFQTDYPNVRYGQGTVATSGCGITALAMVATYLTGHEYLPDELAGYFGGRAENNIARLELASDALQLPWTKAVDFWDVMEALEEGKIVIALMNDQSIFTSSQHFIVLTGLNEEGKIMVNDPYQPNYDYWLLKNAFFNGFSQGDIICGFSGGWIYDPSAMPEDPFIYTEEKVVVETRYPQISLTAAETELLAKVIWVEARGESAKGQQAIAEIVFNRMVSEDFPDTLVGVIYAENQFRSVDYLDEATPTQAQYEAIEAALTGESVLPIDVVYFATYRVNDNVWGKIGGHIFCYGNSYELPVSEDTEIPTEETD